MKTYLPRIAKIIVVAALVTTMAMLSSCIFQVTQPESALSGQSFTADIDVYSEITDTYQLYLGIRLPVDWQIVKSPVYTEELTGDFIYSPTIVSSLDSTFGTIPNTVWWGGVGPKTLLTGGTKYKIVTTLQSNISASGVYTLAYVDGIYTDTLQWRELFTAPNHYYKNFAFLLM